MNTDPHDPIDEETGDEYQTPDDVDQYDPYWEPEDSWLDAAYEDRFDTGYEPDWEY